MGADLMGLAAAFRLPVLFRVLLMGSAGSAMLGGPFDGREGRGNAVAIVVDICRCNRRSSRSRRGLLQRGDYAPAFVESINTRAESRHW